MSTEGSEKPRLEGRILALQRNVESNGNYKERKMGNRIINKYQCPTHEVERYVCRL